MNIDSDPHAKLCDDTLNSLIDFFSTSQVDFDSTHIRIKRTAESISDLMRITAPLPSRVDGGYEMMSEN